MSYDAPQSRNEAILQNILGANNVLVDPQSRIEAILQAILYDETYDEEAMSRMEELLLAIKNNGTWDHEPISRNEEILYAKLNSETYDKEPQSRIEALLIDWCNQSPITVVTDTAPYLFRQSGGDNNAYVGTSEEDTLVGASAVINQMAQAIEQGNYSSNYSYTSTLSFNNGVVTSTARDGVDIRTPINCIGGHKYIVSAILTLSITSNLNVRLLSPTQLIKTISLTANSSYNYLGVFPASGNSTSIQFMGGTSEGNTLSLTKLVVSDLTAMFGTTIADYIYSLEQATAGSGIAYLRKYGFFTKDYIPYTANTLQSVNTSKHTMIGFNQWDEVWENGTFNTTTGANINNSTVNKQIRSKNYIPVVGNALYYINQMAWFIFFDENKNVITEDLPSGSSSGNSRAFNNTTFKMPKTCSYVRFYMLATYGDTYNNDVCLNINSSKNGTYEPYTKHEYALPNIDLRGLYKLDASNNLYADGDTLEGDGTLTRKYEQRPYQSGDESLADAITDGTNTVVKLATPTTEQATGFTNPQVVSKDGTEEYTDERDFPLPVGHETIYPSR